jgi:hypothetical protein
MLRSVIGWLGLANAGRRERHADRNQEARAEHKAVEAAIERLATLRQDRKLPSEIVAPISARYRDRLAHLDARDDDAHHRKLSAEREDIELQMIESERSTINRLYRDGKLKDEGRRHIERALDLREADIANQREDE